MPHNTHLLRPALGGLTALALAVPTSATAQQWETRAGDRNWGLDISLILEGIYYNEMSHGISDPAGFSDGHDHGHDHGNGHDHGFDDGFNLGHNELAFEANLGDLFDGFLMLGFDEDHLDVEEAYLTTRALPGGFQIKAGKFFSDIGYINSRHGHDWDFVDRPLVNEYLFGDHGLQETGVQATWLAPTETYTKLGVELLQGDNSFIPYQGSGGSHTTNDGDEIRSSFSSVSGPRLITAFAKFGPDLGPDHAMQFGISGGYARTWQEETEHGSGLEEWDGDAWFAGLDAVYKYSSGRAYGHGDWRLQGEYFYREIDVDYQRREDQTTIAGNAQGRGKARQDGLYIQGVYGFAPRWEVGLRSEALGLTNRGLPTNEGSERNFAEPSFGTSYRHSAQVTFRPVEPVFLRAQLSQNDFVDEDGDRDRGLEFMLQLNVALGAHGAHRF
ncbi:MULTISPECIES: hypothetical protein [unclassified Thioalkalivibrio]|uniref:hypothetical protein n=1 Tax=unclassified Thioalkalivibrio TaxID=2621013 RepID=UPI0003654155|nr:MULTISPECIES: hypothetical protein [unclassified Thioalkalivibrio]